MNLCETFNVTVGIPSLYKHLLFTDDSKTVKGILAKNFESILRTRKSYSNKCTLVNIPKVGSKLKNGSFDGALGWFERKAIDIYLRSENPFTDSKDIFFSYPLATEDFIIFQVIKHEELNDFNFKMQLVQTFDLQFIFYYVLAFFIFFAVIYLYTYMSFSIFFAKNSKILKCIIEIIFDPRKKNLKILSLFLFGLTLFDFFTKQILTNNIKTTKVIVDTSQFITTEEKLFESPLKAGWIDGETDLDIVKNAPKNTFLNKLYLLKNDNPIKIFEKSLNIQSFEDINQHFFLMKSYVLNMILNIVGSFEKKDGFYSEKTFYEIFTVFYISKFIKKDKIVFLYKFSQFLSQSGCHTVNLKKMSNLKLVEELNKNKLYTNLNSYIDDYTVFVSLKFENFYYFFFLSSFFYIFLLVVFIFSFLIKFYLKNFILEKLTMSL